MTDINAMVIDLSHWDPADDYDAVKRAGIVGVIYKATEGTGYTDNTYVSQQHAAKAAGLKWGAYHFADASDVQRQIENFMHFASPDPDELFCLDWEDYGANTMSVSNCKKWISGVEEALNRPGECVIYSGNTAKEMLDGSDDFFGSRRLWLAQYGSSYSVQESWDDCWLWQYTDGVYGPSPHSIDGVGPCDINSYAGTAQQLAAEWASGSAVQPRPPRPPPPVPDRRLVTVDIMSPPGVKVMVNINGLPLGRNRRAG